MFLLKLVYRAILLYHVVCECTMFELWMTVDEKKALHALALAYG